jgi:uncharacterized protein
MSESDSSQQPATPQTELVKRGFLFHMFVGDRGLRAGWRLLLYVIAVLLLVSLFRLLLLKLFGHGIGGETPGRLIAGETALLISAVLPAVIAARLEKRPWGVYGLPLRLSEGNRFAAGLLVGFAALSFLMLLIHLFHGVYLGRVVLHGAALLRYALAWGFAFLLVGVVEEFLFRGYSLYTLATGIGFWPAGVLLSILFGGLHLLNGGEDLIGGITTALTALLFVFSLWRTGTLWFAVGWHASWDWGESFFYGVPDSGQKAAGTLFNPHFQGSKWITGGSVGPEGSVFVFVVTALIFVVIHLLYPQRQWQLDQQPLRTPDQDPGREYQHSA